MTDIVERLRAIDHMSIEDCFLQSALFLHAAAEIERLRLSLSEARSTGRREGMEEAINQAERFERLYAEERDKHEESSHDFYMNNSGAYAAMDIAAAIRAAMEKADG